MKFEFSSRYRDRNSDPKIGKFSIQSSTAARNKRDAIDPVCFAAPMIAWRSGFSYSCTIESTSAVDMHTTCLILNITLTEQAKIKNFFCGAIFTTSNTLRLRILSSESLTSSLLKITVPNDNITSFRDGLSGTIIDYTIFPSNIRVPLRYDLGQYKYIYNETRNEALTIVNVDMETRRCAVEETTAPGWTSTDNLTIRDEKPFGISVLAAGSTTSQIVLGSSIATTSNIGDYVRLRLSDYESQPFSDSWVREITNVDISGTILDIFPPVPIAPAAGNVVEILSFSYDNFNPVQVYEGSNIQTWSVSMESLSIPNIPMKHGDLASIPYLLVELHNNQSSVSNRNLVNTNNPFLPQSIWIAKLDPSTTNQKFLRFNNTDTQSHPQTLVLMIKEPLELTITLPNGAVLDTQDLDNKNPYSSWHDLNLWTVFDFQPKISDNRFR